MKQTAELITLIDKQVAWLDAKLDQKSNDIIGVSKVKDKLAILSEGLGEVVTDAYGIMNELEDEYKFAIAQFKKDFKGGVAKGEIEAEVEFAGKKKDWTQAKNMYKKLNMKLERIDKILESHQQSVSVLVKTGLKNMTGS